MGNIELLFCEGKKEGTVCVYPYDDNRPNCVKIENMKIVPCEHLNATITKVA